MNRITTKEAIETAGDRLVHCIFGSLGFSERSIDIAKKVIEANNADVIGIYIHDNTEASILYGKRRA